MPVFRPVRVGRSSLLAGLGSATFAARTVSLGILRPRLFRNPAPQLGQIISNQFLAESLPRRAGTHGAPVAKARPRKTEKFSRLYLTQKLNFGINGVCAHRRMMTGKGGAYNVNNRPVIRHAWKIDARISTPRNVKVVFSFGGFLGRTPLPLCS